MAIHKLSVRKVTTADSGKYEDGYGLRLVVSESGAKKWVLRYTLHGKRREMGLGSYSSVGLADARTSALKCRTQVAKGADPIEVRRMESKRIPVFYRLRRPLYPGPSARLAECQACEAMGQHPQDLCKACHRQKTRKCHHDRGHPADPLTDLGY